MRADQLMTTSVVNTAPETSVKEVVRLLATHSFTTLPVVNEDGDLAGVVTEADLLRGRILPDPRTLIHEDAVIARDVRHHLSMASRRPWQVMVSDGCVTLTGEGADESERHVATVIASALPGVVGVQVAEPPRSDPEPRKS